MKKIFVGALIFFSFTAGFAQIPVYPDAGMWNTFSIEYPLSDKFSLIGDQEMRLRENFTQLNLFYTNLGVSYRPFNWVKAEFVYRYIDKWDYQQQQFSYRHRLMLDISFKKKAFSLLELSYRHRLQAEERDVFKSDDGMLPEWFSRNKFQVKLDLGKRYFPYIGAEFRYQFHDPRNQDSDKGWHRGRYFAGVDYEINQANSFGIYYLVQQEFDVASPESIYILGLQYSLKLKGKTVN